LKKGYIYIIISTILFSTMEIALKISAGQFNPIQLTFLRFLIGSVILIIPALRSLKKRGCKLRGGDLIFFALSGFICVVVSMVLYQLSILSAPASVVAVLFSCNPVFVILFAFLLLREKIYKHTVVSILISAAGIIFIMNPLKISASVSGIVLTMLAAVTFALYGVMGRGRSQKYGGVALTCFSFIFGSTEMLLLILVTKIGGVASFLSRSGLGGFANIPIFSGINIQNLPALIYIGVFVTGFGFAFYFLAMEATNAATASLVFFIKPALAPVFALIILSEQIGANMIIGIILMLIGSLIIFIPGVMPHKFKILQEINEKSTENVNDSI
jgi:drug/metabolite transporter (DMT)-like permease